ncbi:Distal membrane-arm assembly complex protein 2 [Clonorchis sinensis]|uniref:Distal membrane-arm assembly complex protein 2 n=2 Tax=Clonorchis sinensis TaxID=79923 RepID=A0A8T1MRC1_CLOSI|nr:Distal membrane-arm assembly complex protein 2 [Clonorchis sinensis]
MRFIHFRYFGLFVRPANINRGLSSHVSRSNEDGFTRSIFCKAEMKEVMRDGKPVKIFTGLVDQSVEHVGDQFVTFHMKLTYKHDLDYRALVNWALDRVKRQNRLRQIVSNDAIQHLGLDLAVAHMICNIGGRVKFVGSDKWFFRYANLRPELPSQYAGDLRLSAIDLSGSNVVFEGFELLSQLRDLRQLRLRRCIHVDDFCMSRVGRIANLELLDVSECPRVTSKGLATLAQLKNLRHLLVHNNPMMEDKELVCLLLEEHLPKLFISGVNYLGELPEEARRRVVALIGSGNSDAVTVKHLSGDISAENPLSSAEEAKTIEEPKKSEYQWAAA